MNNRFARLLGDQPQVDHFLNSVLRVDRKKFKDISYRIITCETGMNGGIDAPTSRSSKFRDQEYQDDEQRLFLRKKIVEELFTLPLLDDEDRIRLGRGGARPPNPNSERKAFILIGLPASGKSSIAQMIARTYGAMVLDSDFAKRKLPEFDGYPWGASIVHEESSDIVFRSDSNQYFESLCDKVLSTGYNIVMPKVGDNHQKILQYCDRLEKANYSIHLTLVYLSKEKATLRALNRYKSTNRYIPLSHIFDVYAEHPLLTYFLLKDKHRLRFKSFGIVSTDVHLGQPPVCIDLWGSNPAGVYSFNSNLLF